MSEEINGKVEEIDDEIRDKVEEAAEAVEEGVNEAAEAVEAEVDEAAEAVNDRKEEFNQKVDEVKADVKEAYENVKEKASETFKDVKEGAAAAFATAKEKAQSTVEDIKKEIDDYSDQMDPDDVSKNRLMAVLAYIGPLVLIPIFAAKDSKFAKFHANQGLILFLLEIVFCVLGGLKFIGWLFDLCNIVVAILAIVGIIYAAQGKAKELPVVGNWTILK
ncbi:MAG: hypothetical protein J5374_00165 [Bacteroidales bacterium]|nr:hypothetical protein [Bacteroidales bacterium]